MPIQGASVRRIPGSLQQRLPYMTISPTENPEYRKVPQHHIQAYMTEKYSWQEGAISPKLPQPLAEKNATTKECMPPI